MKINYQDYRKVNPMISLKCFALSDYLCCIFSPIIGIPSINHNIRPNTITLFMIIIGVIGGAVLFIPNVWCKLLSSLLYFIWFTLDCADGEVARFTKCFSKGGKYLDWCAHLVCHPLFIIALWYNLLPSTSGFVVISLLSFFFLWFELVSRNRLSMEMLCGNIENTPYIKYPEYTLIHWVILQCKYFPNFVILFPLLMFFDEYFSVGFFIYFYYTWIVVETIIGIRAFCMFVKKMYYL